MANRVQLTTDGNKCYLNAVDDAFRAEVDYAMLIKIYGEAPGGEVRYSPSQVIGAAKDAIVGKPAMKHVSTSFVERQNLTMWMQMRRFTRLTYAFSKKLANHEAAIALHYMHYNFARIHQTLRVTPRNGSQSCRSRLEHCGNRCLAGLIPMNKLGAQFTETDPNDNAYLVTQMESAADGTYHNTGGVIWVDRAKPAAEDRMKEAVKDCLAGKFTGHRRK